MPSFTDVIRAVAAGRGSAGQVSFPAVAALVVLLAAGGATGLGQWAVASPGSAQASSGPAQVLSGPAQIASDSQLVATLGCGACHTGVPGSEAGGGSIRSLTPALGTDEKPLAPAYIFHYLADPQVVSPAIAPARMPTYELDESQRLALALFATNETEPLRGVDDAFRDARNRYPEVSREDGRALFKTLNCAGCHAHPEAAARQIAPDLSLQGTRVNGEWLRSYLRDPVTIRPAGPVPGSGGQMPDFRLDSAEVEAVAGFLLEQTASEATPWEPSALSPFSMQKADASMRSRWSCLGCHQLGDGGGRVGPRLDGIRHRLRSEYVRWLVEDPGHLLPSGVMPASFEQPDRLDLIASYILQREGEWHGSEPLPGMEAWDAAVSAMADPAREDATAGSASPARGRAVYQARCAPCHGLEGDGDGFNAPFLPTPPAAHSDSAAMSARPDDTLYDGIYAGARILGKSHRMPAFGRSLDDGQIRDLVAYIRELCRCSGPSWSRDGRRPPG